MAQKVVIIGHGFTSRLAVTRSVAQIGCKVTVIVMTGINRFTRKVNTQKPIDCCSKYVNHCFFCHLKDEEGLIQLLLSRCTESNQKVVIIPDSDFSAAVIDRNQERLREYFLFPHINHSPGAVVEWMDKVRQKNLAHEVGMNVASSCVIDICKHHYQIPKDIKYPCFTKPLATIAGGKKFLRKCENEIELKELLEYARQDVRILVEDYKQIDNEFAVLGFSDGQQVIIPGVLQITKMSQSHRGVAVVGKVMPNNGFETLIEQFKLFVMRIGFVGIFDIDFYESGGTFFFGELNLRFGGSGYVITKMGVNLPGMLVNFLCGDNQGNLQSEIGAVSTYLNDSTCIDDWYNGYMSTDEYRSLVNSVDYRFIYDENDYLPQKKLNQYFRRLHIKRFFKLLFN